VLTTQQLSCWTRKQGVLAAPTTCRRALLYYARRATHIYCTINTHIGSRGFVLHVYCLSGTLLSGVQVVQKIEYPIWVVYVTQAMMFGGGLLGISYGILSTSWDPRREGSAIGWTELQVCINAAPCV
jgi:hypothetical protein